MTVVHNTITDPTGAGTVGWVTVRLVGPGFRVTTESEILGSTQIVTEGDGAWEITLTPNTPESPYYVITEQASNLPSRQHVVHIPESMAASTVWLREVVAAVPWPLAPADTVFEGPPGPPGLAGGTGPAQNVVIFGANPNVARPNLATAVLWVGAFGVEPVYADATKGDFLFHGVPAGTEVEGFGIEPFGSTFG